MAELILSGLLKNLCIFLAIEDWAVVDLEIRRMRSELDLLDQSIKVANEEEYSVKVYASEISNASMLIKSILDVYNLQPICRDYLRRSGIQIAKLISHENVGHKIENINAILVNIWDRVRDCPSPRFMHVKNEKYIMAAKDLKKTLLKGQELRRSAVTVLGGIGTRKTPLAASIYLSDAVVKYFEIRIWIAVPNSLDDVYDILRQILGREHEGRVEATSMVDAVREFLRWKRYLIVLDNVWSDKLWHFLRDILADDYVGSKVLVTTCSEAVADSFLETTSDRVYKMELEKFTPKTTSRRPDSFLETTSDRVYKMELGKFTHKTTSRRLNLAMRAVVGLVSTKPKVTRVVSISSSSFASDRFSFFSDDIED